MNQREQQLAALLLDDRFIDWIENPHSQYAEYWTKWMQNDIGNREIVEDARSFLHELKLSEEKNAGELNNVATEEWLSSIKDAIGNDQPAPSLVRYNKVRVYGLAASVLILFLTCILLVRPGGHSKVSEPADKTHFYEAVRYNGTGSNSLVFLPDGSKVTLAKNAKITFDKLMTGNMRKVTLKGEAFFDVARNTDKPFYIYTPNMVIKVLGTSFRVTASDERESVVVKTGKVSVCVKGQDMTRSAEKVLLPNQMASFSTASKELVSGVFTGGGKIEIENPEKEKYEFEDAPISAVFKMLEKMYSLPVRYDEQIFKNCYITISLEEESLEQKLETITKTIGASYVLSENGIMIYGKGCR